MPWSVGDVEGFNKGLTDAEKKRWLGAANGYLQTCLDDGGSAETCEASAIKIANAAVQESRHDTNGLGERILEAVFDEHATVKATVQGFLRAAHAIAKHPNVPAKFKKRVEEIRADLAAHKWADMVGDDSGGTPEAVGASEAIREALQTIARKQVRTRLREVDLGGVSVSEFETKLGDALKSKLGTASQFYIVDVYDDLLVFNDDDGMWGAPYKVGPDGSVSLGKPVRVKRLCRYIPEEGTEKPPEDRGEQPGEQSLLPGDWWKYEDWWKYSQYWNTDGNKALGGGAPASSPSQGQEALREATKTEDGKAFPASDFAYVPDPDKPSEWKLRLTATPGGKPDSGIVGAAIAALGPGGFRGNRVEIPAADLAGVKARVRAAWKKANPDKEATDMPPVIREAFTEEGAIVEAATFNEDGALVEEGGQNG